MFREITIVNEAIYQLSIPKELRGKKIEIIAFEIGEDKPFENNENKANNPKFAERTKDLVFSTNGYKFNRNDANDYP